MERQLYPILNETTHCPVRIPGQTDFQYGRTIVTWRRGLTPEQQTINNILEHQYFGLLGIDSAEDLPGITEDPQREHSLSFGVLTRLGVLFGIKENYKGIREKFQGFGETADTVIDDLQRSLSYPSCTSLEMVNEIRAYNNPATLLAVATDGTWADIARFEAKRKLQLMALAASISRREREVGIADQFERFSNWLNDRVWNPQQPHAESTNSYLISDHNSETWGCTSARIVNYEDGLKYRPQALQKKTNVRRRSFIPNGSKEAIDAYVTVRGKKPAAKVLKMLRKGAEDPAIAVDDDTGLLVVVNNRKDIDKLISHLITQGYQSDFPVIIEDLVDTLNGSKYDNRNGGSNDLRMLKFFVRLANEMRVECILHTPQTYADYKYARRISHEEYELDRLFAAVDVPRLLFPEKYFPGFDMDLARRIETRRIRKEIEEPLIG